MKAALAVSLSQFLVVVLGFLLASIPCQVKFFSSLGKFLLPHPFYFTASFLSNDAWNKIFNSLLKEILNIFSFLDNTNSGNEKNEKIFEYKDGFCN